MVLEEPASNWRNLSCKKEYLLWMLESRNFWRERSSCTVFSRVENLKSMFEGVIGERGWRGWQGVGEGKADVPSLGGSMEKGFGGFPVFWFISMFCVNIRTFWSWRTSSCRVWRSSLSDSRSWWIFATVSCTEWSYCACFRWANGNFCNKGVVCWIEIRSKSGVGPTGHLIRGEAEKWLAKKIRIVIRILNRWYRKGRKTQCSGVNHWVKMFFFLLCVISHLIQLQIYSRLTFLGASEAKSPACGLYIEVITDVKNILYEALRRVLPNPSEAPVILLISMCLIIMESFSVSLISRIEKVLIRGGGVSRFSVEVFVSLYRNISLENTLVFQKNSFIENFHA